MEMGQEIEFIFENITERPTFEEIAVSTSAYLFRYLTIFVCILGILLNTLIIFVVLRGKQMRTRTNLVFANRCIYNILHLGSEFFFFCIYWIFGDAVYESHSAMCAILHTMGLFEMSLCGFTLMMLSNKLMNTKEVSTKTLLIFGNSLVLVFYIAQVIQCVQMCGSRYVVEGITAIVLGVLLVSVTLTKDVNRCRRNANIPISKDSNFRLNIARILTYNWTFCFFIAVVPWRRWTWSIAEVCVILNAVYTFVYVFCSDEAYKTRILKVLNLNFDLDEEDIVMENCVYAKTTRKNQNIVVDFKPLDDVVVDES